MQNEQTRDLISTQKMSRKYKKEVPLVEFMYFVFACMPGENYI